MLSICSDGVNAEAAGVDNAEQLFNPHWNPDGHSGSAAASEGRPAARDPHGFVDSVLSRKREKAQPWKMLDSCIDLTGSRKGHVQNTADPRERRRARPLNLRKTQCIPTFCPPPTSPGTQPPRASGGLSLSLSLSLSLKAKKGWKHLVAL